MEDLLYASNAMPELTKPIAFKRYEQHGYINKGEQVELKGNDTDASLSKGCKTRAKEVW